MTFDLTQTLQRRKGRRAASIPLSALVSEPARNSTSKSQETEKDDSKSSNPFDRPASSGKANDFKPKLETQSTNVEQTGGSSQKANGKPAGLRREQSDLFKSFAKPKTKLENTEGSSEKSPPSTLFVGFTTSISQSYYSPSFWQEKPDLEVDGRYISSACHRQR